MIVSFAQQAWRSARRMMACGVCVMLQTAASGQSNVVVIISDDAGWADFGFQRDATSDADPGNLGAVPTPNLDVLAGMGVSFVNAYAGSVCAPSRAMLVSGQYGGRFGFHQNLGSGGTGPIDQASPMQGVPASVSTIFERMQQTGYRTSVVGKWHLGEHTAGGGQPGNLPQFQGIETFEGLHGGSRSYFVGGETGTQALRRTLSDGAGNNVSTSVIEGEFNGQYITDVLGDLSANYIRDHAGAAEPFFLYSSFTAPHTPMQATAADLSAVDSLGVAGFTGNRRVYAAMQLALDRNVGKILEQLHDPNGDGDFADSIREQTMIIFVNDNGGDSSDSTPNFSDNGVLRNGKGSQFEGGLRVPFIVAGAGVDPGVRGSVSTQLAHVIDILPTAVLGAGGGTLTPGEAIDGVNLLPYVNGQAEGVAHEDLFLQRYAGQQSAVRKGDWKYMYQVGNPQLYNLATDPGEQSNIIGQNPKLAEELKLLMTSYIVQMDKARVDIAASTTNQFDHFRLLTQDQSTLAFSQADAWRDANAAAGSATMSFRDGFADARLVFETKTNGSYVVTNDLQSVGGVSFITNRIDLVDRGVAMGFAQSGEIAGLPVMLAQGRDGTPASIRLDANDPVADRFTFAWNTDIELHDSATITGDGNQRFEFGGEIRSLRPDVSLTKVGSSTMTLRGRFAVSGGFDVQGGTLELAGGPHVGDLRSGGTIRVLGHQADTPNTSGPLTGLVETGLELSFDAGADLSGDAVWTDQRGNNNLSFAAPLSAMPVDDAVFSALNSAYGMPRAGGVSATFFEVSPVGQSGEARSRRDGTFELVFNVEDLAVGGDQVLLDVGGSGRGLNLTLRGDVLTAAVRGDTATQTFSTTIDQGWQHAVLAIEQNTPDNMPRDRWSLYLNNVKIADSALAEIDDWAGGNPWGVGDVFSSTPDPASGFNPVAFVGQVALARYYADLAFGDAQVQQNYGALTAAAAAGLEGPQRSTVSLDGDFTQFAGGTLVMSLASVDDHDKLVVSGQLTAGGTLVVEAVPGFAGGAGSTFDLFDFAAVVGRFETVLLPQLADGLGWDTSSLLQDGRLLIVQQTALIGDFDNSGQVEQGDLDLVLNNWGVDTAVEGVPVGWINQLPDGRIDQNELDRVLNHWGSSSPPRFSSAGTNIPEPGAMGVFVASMVAAGRGRFA